MKKIYTLILSALMLFGRSQTATNFNANDCNSINHDLFTELNSGKVIVLCWVMPCSACISAALSAFTQVQSYQSTYPNKVLYYLVDDYANTNCSSLTSWASANGIVPHAAFSNAAISMNDYGGAGMPKVVVLGGSSHTVFDNQNNTLNVTQFNTAINQAIVASSIGINEINSSKNNFSVYPNPSNGDRINLSYTLNEGSQILIEIYNVLGAKVKEITNEYQNSGKHEFSFDSGLKNGTYLLKFSDGKTTHTSKLVINR